MNEQRKYSRFPLTATARIVHANGTSLYAMTINISRDGVGLYSNSSIDYGTEVRLDVMFKDIRGKDMMEMLKGKIVYCYKWHWVYVTGIQFNQLLNHDETPYLLECIDNCEKRINTFDHY